MVPGSPWQITSFMRRQIPRIKYHQIMLSIEEKRVLANACFQTLVEIGRSLAGRLLQYQTRPLRHSYKSL